MVRAGLGQPPFFERDGRAPIISAGTDRDISVDSSKSNKQDMYCILSNQQTLILFARPVTVFVV